MYIYIYIFTYYTYVTWCTIHICIYICVCVHSTYLVYPMDICLPFFHHLAPCGAQVDNGTLIPETSPPFVDLSEIRQVWRSSCLFTRNATGPTYSIWCLQLLPVQFWPEKNQLVARPFTMLAWSDLMPPSCCRSICSMRLCKTSKGCALARTCVFAGMVKTEDLVNGRGYPLVN